MDGDDKTARARKQRMRARREADGMAQVSGWVPTARRAYAREVLRAVAEGSNSLPPDPEMAAALDAVRADLSRAHAQIEARETALQAARDLEARLQAERDEARAAEVTEREKVAAITSEAREAARAAQEAKERTTEALQRAEKAETAIRQAKALPGIKGRLVRWLAGDVLSD
ncbi:MAG: hypothetical protein PHI71_10890 [Acidiphilium sp.]|nr:hypothetical protein [Acidiphilium sp.]